MSSNKRKRSEKEKSKDTQILNKEAILTNVTYVIPQNTQHEFPNIFNETHDKPQGNILYQVQHNQQGTILCQVQHNQEDTQILNEEAILTNVTDVIPQNTQHEFPNIFNETHNKPQGNILYQVQHNQQGTILYQVQHNQQRNIFKTISTAIVKKILIYLGYFDRGLEFSSKYFFKLSRTLIQEEKKLLKKGLKNETSFQECKNFPNLFYFDFFHQSYFTNSRHWECVKTNSYFARNLVLLHKSIKQMLDFKIEKKQYKYVLCNDGVLYILKKNQGEKNFEFETNFQFDKFQYNWELTEQFITGNISMKFYKKYFPQKYNLGFRTFEVELHKNGLRQRLTHFPSSEEIVIDSPVPNVL